MPQRFRTGSALFLAGARGVSLLGFLAATALLSRLLSKADYGTFRQCWILYSSLAPIVAVGLTQSLFFYLPRLRSGEQWVIVRRTLLAAGVAASVIGVVALGSSGWIASAFSNPSIATFALFTPFLLLSIPTQLSDGVFMPANRAGHAALFNVLNRLVVLLALALPIWLGGLSLDRGLVWLALAQGLLVALMAWLGRRVHRSSERGGALPGLREQLSFALPLAGASIFGAIFLQLDKIVVARLMSPDEFAVYSNGAFENPVTALLASASAATVATELVRLHHARDSSGFVALWRSMFQRLALVVLPMAAFMLAFAPELVVLLFSQKYAQSAGVFRIYVLLAPVRIVGFSTLLMAVDRNRAYLFGHAVACVVMLAAAVPLAKSLGPLGPAIAMVGVSYGLAAAFLRVTSSALGASVWEMVPLRTAGLLGLLSLGAAAVARAAVDGLGLRGLAALAAGGAVFLVAAGVVGAATGILADAGLPVGRRRGSA